jgi:hypothetical protein
VAILLAPEEPGRSREADALQHVRHWLFPLSICCNFLLQYSVHFAPPLVILDLRKATDIIDQCLSDLDPVSAAIESRGHYHDAYWIAA